MAQPDDPIAASRSDEAADAFKVPDPFQVSAQGLELTFYPGGPERLEALLAMIKGARRSVIMCFYILADDPSGRAVRDALDAAVGRGVDVRVVIDGFGSNVGDGFLAGLREKGARVWKFSARWSRRYLIRNHQKFVIVDEERMILGGFNCAQAYFDSPDRDGWHDLGVEITGHVADDMVRWYRQLEGWVDNPKAQWFAMRRMVARWQPGDGPVRLLIGGPTTGLSSWAKQVGRDLDVGQRLDMVMAYFSPPKRLMRRIAMIAQRGRARLVMAGKSDNGATIGATRSLYSKPLAKGAEIYEFVRCRLHMKLIVVDNVVYVGSANFDMRSLYLNLELMLRIEDAALAERMRGFVDANIAGSQKITADLHARRATMFNRFRWKLSWFLVSVLDYTVSRRLNLGQ